MLYLFCRLAACLWARFCGSKVCMDEVAARRREKRGGEGVAWGVLAARSKHAIPKFSCLNNSQNSVNRKSGGGGRGGGQQREGRGQTEAQKRGSPTTHASEGAGNSEVWEAQGYVGCRSTGVQSIAWVKGKQWGWGRGGTDRGAWREAPTAHISELAPLNRMRLCQEVRGQYG